MSCTIFIVKRTLSGKNMKSLSFLNLLHQAFSTVVGNSCSTMFVCAGDNIALCKAADCNFYVFVVVAKFDDSRKLSVHTGRTSGY